MSLLVASCQESGLAHDFASALNAPLIQIKFGRFADTEIYVDVAEQALLKDSDVLFIHQFFLFNNTQLQYFSINDQLVSLLFACDYLKNIGVKNITAVLPYLPYSRQCESFNKKLVGPIKLWGRFFQAAGVNKVFACDLHSEADCCLFPILKEISLSNFWIDIIKNDLKEAFIKNQLCLVSPDKGGFKRVSDIAMYLDLPIVCIFKERITPDQPHAIELEGNVRGKIAVIVDDIIDTGKTATQACTLLKGNGATKVFGLFTHPIFSAGAIDRLVNSEFDKIVISDTLLLNSRLLNSGVDNNKILIRSINNYLIKNISKKLS